MSTASAQPIATITDGFSYLPADTSVPLLDSTLGQLIRERAEQHPDRVALVANRYADGQQVRLTYRELLDAALRTAAGLSRITEPGDLVALWAPNVAEWPIIEYGAALAGVVLVALNPALRQPELEYALGHSKPKVMLYAESARDYDMAAVVAQVGENHPGVAMISLRERARWQAEDAADLPAGREPTDPQQPVMLQYTSGTTGNPKGVLLRHTSLVNVARLTAEALQLPDAAVGLNPLPMFHTAACVIGTISTHYVGGTEVLIENFQPVQVLDVMRKEEANVLYYVPAVLGALLEVQRGASEPAPQLSCVLGGGANVPSAMIEASERVFGSSVYNLFGQTELAPVLTLTRPGDSREDQLTTIGAPLPQMDVKVVDPATGDTVPLGVDGEICARGFNQLIEYLHDPAATAATIDADGFVHTGDLGRMDERGYLSVTGRLKELIIRGGENIAPAEIESALARHEQIVSATVVGLPDERLGEVVAAVVHPRGEPTDDLKAELDSFLRSQLTPFKIPSRWFVANDLPVTPTGKVRKFQLVEQIQAGSLAEL